MRERVTDMTAHRKYQSLGEYMKYAIDWVIPPMCAVNAPGMGWSEEKTHEFVLKCHEALHDSSYHAYMYVYVWTGQRPDDPLA